MTKFHAHILSLFPEMFPGTLGLSLSGKALERGDWSYSVTNPRDFGEGVHRAVDDTPYGGGAGMVMRADVLEKALLSMQTKKPLKQTRKLYLSPRGRLLDQSLVQELSVSEELILLCGRYEGVDQRFLDAHDFEEVSIGDYVLSGGEPAAMILMDACIRLLPGVMGNAQTSAEESHTPSAEHPKGLLEYPHYTKPAAWQDAHGNTHNVPDALTSGHHANIEKWRHEQSLSLTRSRRPDLLKKDDG